MSAITYAGVITRANQKPDVIYVQSECETDVFVSPDGDGRYWYDSVEDAIAEHGDLPIVYCTVDPWEI